MVPSDPRRNAYDLESRFAALIEGAGYHPSGRDRSFDFERADGAIIVEFKPSTLGGRDLRAGLLQLAFALREMPDAQLAVLVTRARNIRTERIQHELDLLRGVFQADLADRLSVIAVDHEDVYVLPRMFHGADSLKEAALSVLGEPPTKPIAAGAWTPRTFSVWLILFDAWLRKNGPLPLGRLGQMAGCSLPTVATTVERLRDLGELTQRSNRSVSLNGFPGQSLHAMLVLSDSLRPVTRFVDASGRPLDPERLHRRLMERAPANLALGGVVAARHYQPNFDLNGIPRIDLSCHGGTDFSWLERVDPGLRPAEPHERGYSLVVRTIESNEPRFEFADAFGGRVAGPAEVLLDLYDLRLTNQAEDFVRAVRRR